MWQLYVISRLGIGLAQSLCRVLGRVVSHLSGQILQGPPQ
jgi:hypothetical protein